MEISATEQIKLLFLHLFNYWKLLFIRDLVYYALSFLYNASKCQNHHLYFQCGFSHQTSRNILLSYSSLSFFFFFDFSSAKIVSCSLILVCFAATIKLHSELLLPQLNNLFKVSFYISIIQVSLIWATDFSIFCTCHLSDTNGALAQVL